MPTAELRGTPKQTGTRSHLANVNISERNSKSIAIKVWSVKLQLYLATQPGGVGDLGDLGEPCSDFFSCSPLIRKGFSKLVFTFFPTVLSQ